jgi:E3 ubiquitin-protein ligase RNF144
MATSSQQPVSDPQFVDDFYFSALFNENEDKLFPISDSIYAEELQFQEALISAVIASQSSTAPPPPFPLLQSMAEEEEPKSMKETGESSTCFCEICADKKQPSDMLQINACSHSFCSDCISKHVTAKIQSNITLVLCPSYHCGGVLEFGNIGAIVPPAVAARWGEMLCESLIPASEKFYCPFKDCSAMMVKDDDDSDVIRESECPVCHRLFCATCYVAWHPGIECEEFMRLNEDERGREDLMVREMAKSQSWSRCPHCKYYVEKTEGCLHMTCRCGFQFCYACGATWSQDHGGCQP